MLGKFITHCEDSLTAAVFTHLLHLPIEVFWEILRHACYKSQLPHFPGDPQLVAAWPNWDSAGTGNTSRVIPDLFMRLPKFDLIIEAKRWDHGMQNSAQWERELKAYTNVYGHEHRQVRMIALGGIYSYEDKELPFPWPAETTNEGASSNVESDTKCLVHMCRWSSLLLECQRMENRLADTKELSSQTRAHLRILDDVIDLFAWHGYVAVRWFRDFDFEKHLLSESVDCDQQSFYRISLQFQNQ